MTVRIPGPISLFSIFVAASLAGCALDAPRDLSTEKAKLVIETSSSVAPLARALVAHRTARNPNLSVVITESNSAVAARSFVGGSCDAALLSRFLRPDEFRLAVYNGIQPVAHPLALDALALVTHPDLPLRDISLAQLRDIYAGRIANWKELGGPDLKITRIIRDAASGSAELFDSAALNRQKPVDAETAAANSAVHDRILRTPGSIGYVGLSFTAGLNVLSLNGVRPDPGSVRSGEYPLARTLYLFTNGVPRLGSELQRLTALPLTRPGSRLVRDAALIPPTE